MKRLLLVGALAALAACGTREESGRRQPVASLDTEKARVSYMVGLDVARDLKPIRDELDLAIVDQAIRASLADEKPLMDEAAITATRASFTRRLREKREAQRQALAAGNARKGELFLAANARQPGVRTTPSGLQYQQLRVANGPRPRATDTVRVNYRGTLLDGSEFESTYATDHPAEFPLSRVMPGLREAIPLMPVGSRYRFWVPASLAYGEQGVPGAIEPNATLVFEVELLAIARQ